MSNQNRKPNPWSWGMVSEKNFLKNLGKGIFSCCKMSREQLLRNYVRAIDVRVKQFSPIERLDLQNIALLMLGEEEKNGDC